MGVEGWRGQPEQRGTEGMQYIARYIRPKYGPVVGTSRTVYGEYQSDANARRFLARKLQADHFPAGQYLLETWPGSGSTVKPRVVGHLYKLVKHKEKV